MEKQINLSNEEKDILNRLEKDNRNVLSTIDYRILSSRFTSRLTIEELSRIVCDEEFQKRLLELDDDKCELFFKLKKLFLKQDNWITGSNMIVKALNNPSFSELSKTVLDSNDENLMRKYFELINQEQNYFGIKSVEELRNYEQIKNSICDSILLNSSNTEGLTQPIGDLSELDRVRFAVIEKNFGISLNQAKLLCQKKEYCNY